MSGGGGFRIAVVQMCRGADVAANLRTVRRSVESAAGDGAMMVFLPENFAFMGHGEKDRLRIAEDDGDGPIQGFLSGLAHEHGVWLVAGTIPMKGPEADRCRAACLVFDAGGARVARYDKMHLFDVGLPQSREYYLESQTLSPGDRPVVCATPLGPIGLSVCYDLRFPELYRQLAAAGAVLLSVPSAFTAATGSVHWDTLVRARAIENLCYVAAPGQAGRHENGRETWGHSLIVGPWGETLGELGTGEGVVTALVEPDRLAALRERFPALTHRRLGGFRDLEDMGGGSN